MTRKEFEAAVNDAYGRLPRRFRDALENIEIVIEADSPQGDLGLYEGVPLTERTCDYANVLPDKITLYQREIEEECREHGLDVREEIAHTLRHEIAHYFGISDERLDELDVY